MKKRLLPAILVLLVAFDGVVWYVASHEDRQGVLTVAFLNVGQGDATFIDSPGGRQMLVDGGPSSSVLRRLSEVMPFYDRSIDVVVATSPDADHVGGLVDALSRFHVDYVVMPEATSSSIAFAAFADAVKKSGATVVYAKRGTVINLGGGADFRILFPDASSTGAVVGKVEYGKESFLLAPDAPKAAEKFLLASEPDELRAPVFEPGYDQYQTTASDAFVSAVAPTYAVVSTAATDAYGRPTTESFDALHAYGANVFRTDKQGTIVFQTDGKALSVSFKP